MKKNSLGRGLDELFSDNSIEQEVEEGQVIKLPISDVEPNKNQPRKLFDREKLTELSSSIAEHGLLQPITVRKVGERYQIISGERRWRASRMAGLMEIPAIVREIDDKTTLELGLIENLQREDLNVVEEAKGYKALIEEFEYTQEQVAKRVGKSRPAVANAMRILSLPESILTYVLDGKLSSGHARAMLPLTETFSEAELIKLAKEIIDKDLTVRDIEAMSKKKPKEPKKAKPKNIYYKEIEDEFSGSWGRKVKINKTAKGGTVTIDFYGDDDLNTLIDLLRK